jgi:hypothetical protein
MARKIKEMQAALRTPLDDQPHGPTWTIENAKSAIDVARRMAPTMSGKGAFASAGVSGRVFLPAK